MAGGSLARDLRARVDGEVRFDAGSRGMPHTPAGVLAGAGMAATAVAAAAVRGRTRR